MIDNATIMRAAKAYAKANVIECCREIIEWQDTAVLRSGRVRELADVLRPMVDHDALRLAESLIKRAAMEKIAEVV